MANKISNFISENLDYLPLFGDFFDKFFFEKIDDIIKEEKDMKFE